MPGLKRKRIGCAPESGPFAMKFLLSWLRPQVFDGTWTPTTSPASAVLRPPFGHPVESNGLVRRWRHEPGERRATTSKFGTNRKGRNARVFPELGIDQLCHQPAGHSRP